MRLLRSIRMTTICGNKNTTDEACGWSMDGCPQWQWNLGLRARQLPCPRFYISTQAPAPHFLLLPPPLASLALPQTTPSNQHQSCPVSSHQPSICGTRLPLPASPVPPSRSYSRRSRLLPTSVLCRLGTQPQLYSTSPHTQVAASGCSPINPQRPVSIRLNLKKKI